MPQISTGPFSGFEQNGYAMILCDPPWSWVNYAGKGSAPHRTEDAPYSVMTLDELKELPVGQLAKKDCVLIMWIIGSHLKQAIQLGESWGFEFKSDCLTWVKIGKHDPSVRPITMGKWTRKQVEMALIFSKGKPKRIGKGVRQLIEADEIIYEPRREHSRKPDCQYERIEALVEGPFIELFARHHRDGWASWGNETVKFDPVSFDRLGLGDDDTFDPLGGL